MNADIFINTRERLENETGRKVESIEILAKYAEEFAASIDNVHKMPIQKERRGERLWKVTPSS